MEFPPGKKWFLICIIPLFLSVAAFAFAADAPIETLLPRLKPTEPKDAISTFRIAPGLKIELVASEPLISDPIDIAWDENGKLYVCELWNYPGEPKAGEPLGRIRLLEDTQGTGQYDKSTIFADHIKWPSGIICSQGGVFVLSSPDLLYLKDTQGTGTANVQKHIFTGFSGRTYEVPNAPRFGIDGRIYICGSYAGGSVMPVQPAKQTKPAKGRDFRFNPVGALSDLPYIEAVSGGGEFGNTLDDFGNRFTCDATNLMYHPVLPREFLTNRYLPVATVQENCYQSWATIHAISPVEPWKKVRETFWSKWVNTNGDMNAGRFPPNELAPHGFATSAAGLTIYRGSAYGAEYAGNAFIGEPANNVVVRLKVEPRGAGFRATRPGENDQEFLASTDNFFRPVNFANGPDGCLYVVSMYREVIEDESAIPKDILKHLDLYSGRERGRIYRVIPDRAGWKRPAVPKMGSMTSVELVRALNSPDGWVRDTAQRLLIERRQKADLELVTPLVTSAKNPATRAQAIWTLIRMTDEDGFFDARTIAAAMTDADARVREQAVWASASGCVPLSILNGQSPATPRLLALAKDPDPRVRLAVAFALQFSGSEHSPAIVETLARMSKQNSSDPWIRTAILTSAGDREGELLRQLSNDAAFTATANGREFIGDLAQMIGSRFEEDEITSFLGELDKHEPARAIPLLHRFTRGMSLNGKIFSEYLDGKTRRNLTHLPLLRSLFGKARELTTDMNQKDETRLTYIDLLASDPFNDIDKNFAPLLSASQSPTIQIAAIKALAGRSEKNIAPLLIAQWKHLGPAARPELIDGLLRRPERVPMLLDALENKVMLPGDIPPGQKAKLSRNKDQALRERATRLLGATASHDRQIVIDQYRSRIQNIQGDVSRGKEVFATVCFQCHGESPGHPRVGPDLATLEDRSPDTLLINILDPNRDVKPIFVGYSLVTQDGQDYVGVIASETAASVTIRHPVGEETILRSNIKSLNSTGLSLMPDGLEAGLSPGQMADLIAFLRQYH